ncbi:MAG: PAS domain S-box protein [Deltaproteobacteria bacterium]|nr:PAS domain S-box protein [Deltaproteobacteria bacterium]
MNAFNVAIVGGGPGCLAIIDMISSDRLRQLQMNLVGIADINPNAPAFRKAKSLNIYTTQDYHDLFSLENLNLIIELTGNPAVSRALQRETPSAVQVMDHTVARLFWEVLRLEEEKIKAQREGEERLEAERDQTAAILDNLSDGVLLITEDFRIENVNETCLSQFHVTREEVIGQKCFEMFFCRSEPCETTFCPLTDLSPEHAPTRHKEYSFLRQGKRVYYEADYNRLDNVQGDGSRWLITLRDITNRKRLELDLEKSRKRYKDLFQNAREGLAFFDDRGKILEVNFSLGQMLGYTSQELETMTISDLAVGSSKSILQEHLDGLKILGFVPVEMEFVTKDGAILPVECQIRWVQDDKLFQMMTRDLSLKKKLEESMKVYSEKLEKEVEERTRELRKSEKEATRQRKTAEGILHGTPIPMFVLDKDHKIAYWNKACENLTGFPADEMIGTDRHWEPFFPHKRPLLADLIIDGDLQRIQELYRGMHLRKSSIVEGAFEAEHFFSHLGKNGTHLYFNAAPIKDDSGAVQGAIITYQDFSERVRMTEEIKRREAFVQNLIQNSIDGIIATNEKGNIVIFNRGAAEILGYAPAEIIGKMSYQEILSPGTAKLIRAAFYGHDYGPVGKIINMEVQGKNKDGAAIPLRLSGTLLYEAGQEVGSVVFIQDLREIHRLQKEKEQAQRMAAIGRTVAGLAHYIKNILNGLRGGAYVIDSAMSKQDLDLIKKGWDMVERNIDQIGNIVMDMLIYSSERKPQYEWIDPNEIVNDILELMADRAGLSRVALVSELDGEIGKVAMDRMAIHRCLLNLVSNAIDACTLEGIVKGNAQVAIRTDKPPGWGVRFRVTDNGTGIDQETQEKLFKDFYTTKGYKGTGLGLPVTHKIVQEHEGKVFFETEPGKGTTFTLLLPEK